MSRLLLTPDLFPLAESRGRLLDVIHEEEELLVINKPAGLVCHPTKGDAWSSLISRVRLHLGQAVQPHLINRLDRETSGLILVAKTSQAALTLRAGWEKGRVGKFYLAIVHGLLAPQLGRIDAPLGRDRESPVVIKDRVCPDGAPSVTEYRTLSVFERDESRYSLLEVRPLTGRKHQIRIHLAHLGHPIVGDKLYGGDERLYLDFVQGQLTDVQRARLILPYQALHAGRLDFEWRGARKQFEARPERWFVDFSGVSPGSRQTDRVCPESVPGRVSGTFCRKLLSKSAKNGGLADKSFRREFLGQALDRVVSKVSTYLP